jgi:signal peptidase I
LQDDGLDTSAFVRKGKDLYVSCTDLMVLMRAVTEKRVPFRFKARGFSMAPFINDSDVITVSPLTGSSPRLGDVVAFTHPQAGRLVVHRVVGKRNGSYLIKGDNTIEYDGLVPRANIAARAVMVERDGERAFAGLGPERRILALLSRKNMLLPLLNFATRTYRLIFKRGTN